MKTWKLMREGMGRCHGVYATSTYLAIMAAVVAVAGAGATAYSGYQQNEVAKDNAELQADAAQDTLTANASDAWKQLKMDEAEMASNRVYFNTSGMTINDVIPLGLCCQIRLGIEE